MNPIHCRELVARHLELGAVVTAQHQALLLNQITAALRDAQHAQPALQSTHKRVYLSELIISRALYAGRGRWHMSARALAACLREGLP